MIRPEDMAGFTDPMERIFLDLQNRIMEDVVRRIVKMGEITRTADMQMGTIRKLGGSTSFIRAELKRMAGLTDKELGRLFSDVIKKGYSDNAEIYRRMGRNFIPAAENRILQSWKKALTDQTAGELKNITRSLGMMWEVRGQKRLLPLADVYQQALDDAAMDIVSGGKSYNTVLRRTVSQLTRSGLRTVDYASGTSTRVEVASRRAVMTGVHQLTGQINLEVAKDLNTDYFEVTWHAGARPEHWWGGRVYSRQQLSLVCGYGSVDGLCGANCRHSFYAFIPGISKRMYSDEQLAEMNAAEQVKKPYADGKSYTTYEATQKQRQMETVMRAQRERIHLLQQGGADDQEILLAKCKYQGEIQEYQRFSRAMGLPPQMDRVYIDGLGRKAPRKGEITVAKRSMHDTLNAKVTDVKHKAAAVKDKVREELLSRDYKTLDIDQFKKLQHHISKEERKIIYGRTYFSGYIKSKNAADMNGKLRRGEKLPKEYEEIKKTLSTVIQRNTVGENIVATRYVKGNALVYITGGVKMPATGLKVPKQRFFDELDQIPQKINVGHIYPEDGFLSVSGVPSNNVMEDKEVKLNILIPRETPAYVTTNNKESEIILDIGTKLEILGSRIENPRSSKWKIVLDCIVR